MSRQTPARAPARTASGSTLTDSELVAARVNEFYETYQAYDGGPSGSKTVRSEFLTESFQRELAREDAASKANPQAAYEAGIGNSDPFTLAQDNVAPIRCVSVDVQGDQANALAAERKDAPEEKKSRLQLKLLKQNGKRLIDKISPGPGTRSVESNNFPSPTPLANLESPNDQPPGSKISDKEKFARYLNAAQKGDAEAQLMVALSYYFGRLGVERNDTEAARWFATAAEGGNAQAQANLGNCYVLGRGVAQNNTEGINWYRKAADQGFAPAQGFLGFCYYNGQGVRRDVSKAISWWRKAAEQGNAAAQTELGQCYVDGVGVSKDPVEGAKWINMAAKQEEPGAQYLLGCLYNTGTGVEKDQAEALRLWKAAAAQGNEDAESLLREIGKMMNKSQPSDAR